MSDGLYETLDICLQILHQMQVGQYFYNILQRLDTDLCLLC
jgi:hypothetical protein